MIEIVQAEGTGEALPLALRNVRNLRGSAGAPAIADDLIVVGQPLSLRLTPENARKDDELAHFIEAEAGQWHYHLITFSCTFVPAEDRQIAAAWVQVELTNASATEYPAPIATSMEPVKESRVRSISATAKIGVPCILLAPEISITGTKEQEQVLLEARYEGTPRPAWHLGETRWATVSGLQRLRLIARASASTEVTGVLSAGATVRYGRFGRSTFSYRSQGPGPTVHLQA
jgi:hypothetical protein